MLAYVVLCHAILSLLTLVTVGVLAAAVGDADGALWNPLSDPTTITKVYQGQLSPSFYNMPNVSVSGSRLRVSGDGTAPAGLFLRYKVKAGERGRHFKIQVSGKSLTGRTTLRFRVDEGTPQWMRAPEGSHQYELVAQRTIEILFYADKAFSYQLDGLSVQRCDSCAIGEGSFDSEKFFGKSADSEKRKKIQFARYKKPSIDFLKKGVRVSGDGNAPAGIYFRYTASKPDQRYTVKVKGQPLSGTTTLRLRIDGESPRWHRAPDGEKIFTLAADREIELLFYADQAFAYRIDDIEIDVCPNCFTDPDLKLQILRESKGLNALLGRDVLKVARQLLKWSANKIDVTWDKRFAFETEPLLKNQTVAEMFTMFDRNQAAALCGESSVFLEKVLETFGIDAITVNYGRQECCLTHVTVLLATKEGNRRRYFVFDPYYSFYLYDTVDKRIPDLFEVIDAVRGGNYSRFILVNVPLDERDFIIPNSRREQFAEVKGQCFAVDGPFDRNRTRARFPGFGFESVMENFSKSMPSLPTGCLPAGSPIEQFVTQIEDGVYGIGGGRTQEVRDEFLTELRKRSIPFDKSSEPIEKVVDRCQAIRVPSLWRCPSKNPLSPE